MGEPVYMYRSCEQHRMLTDFEGAIRRSEVGFHIWTSKEFHQYQVVGRKLPTASDEHPKIYRMKLWATNEVFPEEAEEGQEEQWLMGKWFLLNSPPGEIQFVAKDVKEVRHRHPLEMPG
ncbi:unnamed protein product [Prunus brigantina]